MVLAHVQVKPGRVLREVFWRLYGRHKLKAALAVLAWQEARFLLNWFCEDPRRYLIKIGARSLKDFTWLNWVRIWLQNQGLVNKLLHVEVRLFVNRVLCIKGEVQISIASLFFVELCENVRLHKLSVRDPLSQLRLSFLCIYAHTARNWHWAVFFKHFAV